MKTKASKSSRTEGQAQKPGFLGEREGVNIVEVEAGYLVSFGFDRYLSKVLRGVAGAEFRPGERAHFVPHSSITELDKAAASMRAEYKAVQGDLTAIIAHAKDSAKSLVGPSADLTREQREALMAYREGHGRDWKENLSNAWATGKYKGVSKDHSAALQQIRNTLGPEWLTSLDDKSLYVSPEPQITKYREPGKNYSGPVINANGRFIAQLTGFGERDGAAFVMIHRTADLGNSRPMKGDKVGIVYDEKFHGQVTDLARHKTDAELQAEFSGNVGKKIDGVTVTERGDMLGVQFDINPVMADRIRRLDGAKFHAADKVWEVPAANREYVARAVHDMRNEFVLDAKDVDILKEVATDKMDGAKVSKAFTKDGLPHFGVVLAIGERYALQKAGQDKFSLHHLAMLDQAPTIGSNHEIVYNKGRGEVVDLDLLRAQKQAMGMSL